MSEPLLEVSNLVQEFIIRDRGGVKSGTCTRSPTCRSR